MTMEIEIDIEIDDGNFFNLKKKILSCTYCYSKS